MCYRGLTGIQVKEQHTEKWCRGIPECRRKLWYTQREVMCYWGLTTLQVKDKTTERNHVHKWALSHGGQFPCIFKIFGVYLHPHITHAWRHAHVLACTHMHIKKKSEPFCCEQNCITYKGVCLKQIPLYKKCDVPVFVQSRKSVLAATPKLPRRSTSVLTSPGTPMEEARARWVKYRRWWRSGGGGL